MVPINSTRMVSYSTSTDPIVVSVTVFTVRLRSIRTVLLWRFCPFVCPSVKRVYCGKTKAPSEKSSIMTKRKSPTNFPMNLRWTSYVAPNPPKGASKATFFHFPYKKLGFSWRKSATKFLSVKTFSGKVVRHSLAYLSVHKRVVGDVLFDLKYWAKLTHPFKYGNFQSIFARIVTKCDDFL